MVDVWVPFKTISLARRIGYSQVMTYRQWRRPDRLAQALAAVCAIALGTSNAAAQESGNRATARRLAITAMDKADAGDCVSAMPLLEQAEALFHAPVHLQYIARCQLRIGRLVLAAETYRTLAREKLAPDAPQPFRDAQEEARRELPKVEQRLGAVRLQRPVPEGTTIALDGFELPGAAIDAPLVVDPGRHQLVLRNAAGAASETTFDVREGGTVTVALGSLSPNDGGASVSLRAADAGAGLGERPAASGSLRSGLGTAGIVTASIGGLALAAGAVTLAIRNSDRSALLDACRPESLPCDPKYASDKDRVESLTTVTNLLVFGGASLAVLGAGTWALSRTIAPRADLSVAVLATPGGAFLSATGRLP